MKEGQFPKAKRIGLRAVGWDSLEIERWITERLAQRSDAMRVISEVAINGRVGKTTVTANLDSLMADAGLPVLLPDQVSQPTLSSYYALSQEADAGAYEFIAPKPTPSAQVTSRPVIVRLDLIIPNDDQGQLNTLLLHSTDGQLRLRNLLEAYRPSYNLLLIDTQGARSALLGMAILAADLVLSPITPEMFATRELHCGTLKLMSVLEPFRHLRIPRPSLRLLSNQVNTIRVADLNTATLSLPVHRIDLRQSHQRRSHQRWKPCKHWPSSCFRNGAKRSPR